MKSLLKKVQITILCRQMAPQSMVIILERMMYVATDESVYHLGLCQVFSGSTQITLDTLVEILGDLDTVCGSTKVLARKILAKLKNTIF